MAYTVLARKYRSQRFDDVIGQDPIARTLKNAIKANRVAHAYLFVGTRGVGKTTMARILAKSLNCLSTDEPTTEPCCKCAGCQAINTGEDIDVIEIDGASNNSVDQVRELRENAVYRPARARYKIYIIDEVHMLSTSAFNALLKILEEPPDHVKFIFATTEPNKVIATIQSRCQRFDFNNISSPKIAEQLRNVLKQEQIEYEEDVVISLAKMANGSMRDGLSLLDRLISTAGGKLKTEQLEEYLGCPSAEKVQALVGSLGDSVAETVLKCTQDLIESGFSEVQIVDSLVDCMRDLMVIKSAGADSELLILTSEQRKQMGQLAQKFDIAGLVYNITTLETLRWSIKNSETGRALLETALIRLALSEHFLNVDDLVSQQAGSTGHKKKRPISGNQAATGPIVDSKAKSERPISHRDRQSDSIHDWWLSFLRQEGQKLGKATLGPISSARVVGLQDGLVTLRFRAGGHMAKQICLKNGRKEEIEKLLSEHLDQKVRVKFQVDGENSESAPPASKKKGATEKRNEIIKDPAIQKMIRQLGATVTRVEHIEDGQ